MSTCSLPASMGDTYIRDKRSYHGYIDAAKKVYARSGIKGFDP